MRNTIANAHAQCRKALTSESGISAVETALASAVLLAMLFGVFQMSFALYTYHFISEAAREGSRWAMVRGSTACANTPNLDNCGATQSQINGFVQGLNFPGVDATNNMTVTTTFLTASNSQPTTWSPCTTGTCNAPGNIVKVRVQYNFPLSLPFISATTLHLGSTSQLVIAQ